MKDLLDEGNVDDLSIEVPQPGVYMPSKFAIYPSIDVARVRAMFDVADVDKSGDVSLKELSQSAEWRQMYTTKQIEEMFASAVRLPFPHPLLAPFSLLTTFCLFFTTKISPDAGITLAELFKLSFPLASSRLITMMVLWTEPAIMERTRELRDKEVHERQDLTTEQDRELNSIFDAMDSKRQGTISIDDLASFMTGSTGGTFWTMQDIEALVNQ